jgi:hypothetical protein
MRETDVEVILQRAKGKYLEAKPRQWPAEFITRDFKEFIRISGMTHVRISLIHSRMARLSAGTSR